MIELKSVRIPDFGGSLERPAIPAATYDLRCRRVYERAGKDWLFVYADREHNANILHLTGFDPRFEEAILMLGPGGRRVIVAGNECLSFTAISPLPGVETRLAQSLSLMGQDRTKAPRLADVLAEVGIGKGHSMGIVGWKYLEPEEWGDAAPGYVLPHYMVLLLAKLIGGLDGLSDATAVLMHPETGDRAIVDVDQLAAFEWASTRASLAVQRMVANARLGRSEIEAASFAGYAGEPMSCHLMFSSGNADETIHGLNSPRARVLGKGDGVTAAVGYWGSLSSRAGLLDDSNEAFVEVAKGYFSGLLAWYETADIGVTGGTLFDAVSDRLGQAGLRSTLNPGHLVSYDEWSNSPVRPGSNERIRSGMPFQIDVIPTPVPAGTALNCEDTVAFADAGLRQELAQKHPETWQRIEARRAFMRDELGVTLKDSILPFSSIPLCLAPLWLTPDRLLVNG